MNFINCKDIQRFQYQSKNEQQINQESSFQIEKDDDISPQQIKFPQISNDQNSNQFRICKRPFKIQRNNQRKQSKTDINAFYQEPNQEDNSYDQNKYNQYFYNNKYYNCHLQEEEQQENLNNQCNNENSQPYNSIDYLSLYNQINQQNLDTSEQNLQSLFLSQNNIDFQNQNSQQPFIIQRAAKTQTNKNQSRQILSEISTDISTQKSIHQLTQDSINYNFFSGNFSYFLNNTQYHQLEEADVLVQNDPQYIAAYSEQIFLNMFNQEENIDIDYLQKVQCNNLHEDMRWIVLDWLCLIHWANCNKEQTLFLTISLIDRYLQSSKISKSQLQLLGAASFLIATKFEEIIPIKVEKVIEFTDKAYSKEELISMETDILNKLQFYIDVPTSYNFLKRFSHLTQVSSIISNLALYFLELILMKLQMLKYKPSQLAAACLYCSFNIFQKYYTQQQYQNNAFVQTLLRISYIQEQQLQIMQSEILQLIKYFTYTYNNNNKESNYQLFALQKKFSHNNYDNVSSINLIDINI